VNTDARKARSAAAVLWGRAAVLQVAYDRRDDVIALDQQALEELRTAAFRAAGRPEVRDAVASLYGDVQREVEQARPRCDVSGRCCRFEEFGHRLFVTTIELAAFWYQLETADRSPASDAAWDGTGCPFQVSGLCGVHSIRPFGCRIFFCDPASEGWQREQYERFHARLKRLHEELGVPYAYVEWRQALRAIGVAPVSR
jgi:Fe-S-cluster containining protein